MSDREDMLTVFDLDRRDDLPLHAYMRAHHALVFEALGPVRDGHRRPRRIRGGTPDDNMGFARLPEHYRSVTLPLSTLHPGAPGALIVKGCEPLLEDFDALVTWMARRSFRSPANVGHMPMLEHFALREHKVPGALTIREALAECERSLVIQELHLQHYGALARLPTPLLIQRLSPASLGPAGVAWRRELSVAARERLRPLLDEGLALFGYYYPSLPVRVRGFTKLLPGETAQDRRLRIAGYDLEGIMLAWVTLLVRILYLGYLPYSFHNEGLGACFDPGNACMDGGFVDIDSLVPIASIRDDGAFFDALVASLYGLDRTVEVLLPTQCERETRELFRRQWLWAAYRRAIDEQARPSLRLDPRVRELVEPLPFDRLMTRLRSRVRRDDDFLEG